MDKNTTLNDLFDQLLLLPRFKDYSNEKKEELKVRLVKEYEERVNKAIIVNMPKEKSEEFLDILDTKNIDVIDKFIETNIPNIDYLIEAETSKFIQQLILKGNEQKD
jgi:hypothetical protein